MPQKPNHPGPTDSASVPVRIAIREAETAEQERLIARYLEQTGAAVETVRFRTHQDDRLDSEVRSGTFHRAVFANLDALLTPVWKGYLDLEAWTRTGVEIEVIETPLSKEQLQGILSEVGTSFHRFQQVQNRRQTAAAIGLGLLALVAMAAMIWLVPGRH